MNLRSQTVRVLKGVGELASTPAHFNQFLLLLSVALAAFASPLMVPARAGSPPKERAGNTKVERLSSNQAVAESVRRYIENMVRNNRIQGEQLNTYERAFRNNWNTFTRVEKRILDNPSSLCDPVVRKVYEQVQAALDSAQVFTETTEDIQYQAGGRKELRFPDGTVMTVPLDPVSRKARTSEDYSGAARMTDQVINELVLSLQDKK